MKFIFFVILSTFIYLSNALCGSQKCNKDKIPNELLSGDIQGFDTAYDIGGTIIIKNDCEFQIKNFYVTPEMKKARWTCINTEKIEEGIIISNFIIGTFSKNAPVTLSYDVNEAESNCPVSLLDDCKAIALIDQFYRLIAVAPIEGSREYSTSSSSVNSTSSNNEDQVNLKKNSKGSGSLTWLYILLGVLGGFALASLLAFGYIHMNKKSKNKNNYNDNDNDNNNDILPPPPYSEVVKEEEQQQPLNNNTLGHSEKSKFI